MNIIYELNSIKLNIIIDTTKECILNRKIIISSIPMCTQCHNVNKFSLLKITYVDK